MDSIFRAQSGRIRYIQWKTMQDLHQILWAAFHKFDAKASHKIIVNRRIGFPHLTSVWTGALISAFPDSGLSPVRIGGITGRHP
jgi:hypothetical protein